MFLNRSAVGSDHFTATVSIRQRQFAVNDFGTGYSSLSYLRQFPIDVLKIDQSFIHQIAADPEVSSIVSAIIHMGKSLKHLVIAEGIETREQRTYLQTQRCTEGRGYLFSRPLAAAQFAHLLQMGIAETVVPLRSRTSLQAWRSLRNSIRRWNLSAVAETIPELRADGATGWKRLQPLGR